MAPGTSQVTQDVERQTPRSLPGRRRQPPEDSCLRHFGERLLRWTRSQPKDDKSWICGKMVRKGPPCSKDKILASKQDLKRSVLGLQAQPLPRAKRSAHVSFARITSYGIGQGFRKRIPRTSDPVCRRVLCCTCSAPATRMRTAHPRRLVWSQDRRGRHHALRGSPTRPWDL